MTNQLTDLKAMHQSLSSKTILIQNHPALRQAIKQYFLQTYALYEQLFSILADEKAFYIRAEPLRHPLIFYFGHTATLYVNKFFDHGIIKDRINAQYEKMFAVGVDEMDWDDLTESHYNWPSVSDTKDFRVKVKEMVLNVIDQSSTNRIENWHSDMWVVLLGIEHERIHLQTSAVIMRRVPLNFIQQVQEFVQCEIRQQNLEKIPINKMVKVNEWKGTWDRQKENAKTYGWDNQFGVKQFNVKDFMASEMLVSNGEFLQFIDDGGYHTLEWWTKEGQMWLASIKPTLPLFWKKFGNKYKLRTIFREIDMPWDWPAEVNNLQARAFCKWRTMKTGKYTRLPTEDEYYSLRGLMQKDQPDWKYQEVGNINMEYWMSSNPVNMFKYGGFYDIVGNVWQHTITPIYPLAQFQIHPVYEDFSTPTFDERHDILKGGSFITTGNAALSTARFAFRRHFYQFAGFRYIQTDRQMEVDLHSDSVITDYNVQMNLKHHYLNSNSYVLEAVQKIKAAVGVSDHKKVLTVGCSVGRMPLQFSKIFDESIGIDYTSRYFQMSTRLKEAGCLKFKDIDIDLKQTDINLNHVSLLQMNPENPDEKKINLCDWIVIDGYSIRQGSIQTVLNNVIKLANNNAVIVIINVPGVNSIEKEKAKEIIIQVSGGVVQIGEEQILSASDGDQSYLPVWEHQLDFRLNYFKLSKA